MHVAVFFLGCLLHGLHGVESNTACTSKETCAACIGESPECGWCADEDYSEKGLQRCNSFHQLAERCSWIVRPSDNVEVIKNMGLNDKAEKEAIHIRPQEVKLTLKPNSPVKFRLEFRQGSGYPVDLYFLMDLSNTMENDKDKLAALGDRLARKMGSITRNFRLGFGSYVDKVAAPYTRMHPDKLKSPCKGCAPPFGYINNMPLSTRTREFADKVNESRISANLDGREGGLDAIVQAIVCKNEIGWRNKSRKLLVVATDNEFHFAGDGKMGGIIQPNDGQCHLDSDGVYTMTDQQDYPSLSQLSHMVKNEKVTIIFAVTKDQENQYRKLLQRLLGSSVGVLQHDSSNVVKLIRKQYDEITSHVEMTTNLRDSNLIHVSFESDCLKGVKEKTNVCYGLKDATKVAFDVTVEVGSCPPDRSQWNQSFEIYPVGLHENLKVNLELICECECEKPWNEEKSSPKCSSGKGTYECGICSCYDYNYGKECECDSRKSDPIEEDAGCFRANETTPCSGLGYCRCGKCHCHKRSLSGTYCECNNFSCDKHEDKFCNGHGTCDCGTCKCVSGWTGGDCGCKTSVEGCINDKGELCSGNGKCPCGSCICDTSENEYFGKFCDDCMSCTERCSELNPCVECFLNQEDKSCNASDICSNHKLQAVDEVEINEKEKLCATFEDKEKCRITFKYKIDEPIIYVKKVKECPLPVNVMAIVSGVAGSVVGAGLLLLLMWKLLTTVHDRRELAKFEKERKNAKWDAGDNPLYKEAISTFQNPAFGND